MNSIERIKIGIGELEWFEKRYAFLSLIGVKILNPKHDYSQIEGFIKAPDNSFYKNGIFNFIIKYDRDPKKHPNIIFKTKIYHTEVAPNSGSCCIDCISFLREWKPQITLLGIISVLYEFMVYQCPLSTYVEAHDMSKFKEKCREYVEKYALKEFNPEYDYLCKEDYDLVNNLSWDYFTLTFVSISNENNHEPYQFRIKKEEEDNPASTYISRYIKGDTNRALIVGNKVFHPSVSIKECLNSKIVFLIP